MPLAQFKETYLAHADAKPEQAPAWEVSPDSLPASGWRALDDVTLLRFLRADKRKGEFDQERSMARLLRALQWRKQMRSDALLAQPPNETYEHLRIRRWVGFDLVGRPVHDRCQRRDGVVSATAWCTGDRVWCAGSSLFCSRQALGG